MRKLLLATTVSVAALIPAAPSWAAAGVPQRPAGPVNPVLPSGNGGDNGWGNCGHNSSGGDAHSGLMGSGGGNGGYRPGGSCLADDTDHGSYSPTDTAADLDSMIS